MRIKTLVLSLVIITLTLVTSTGTLAYLVDAEESVATFTTGNVAIQSYTASLGPSQNSIIETTLRGELIDTLDTFADAYPATNCDSLVGSENCIKYTFVKNTGPSDAYVRVRILVPDSLTSGSSPTITFDSNATASDEFTRSVTTGVLCDSNSADTCTEYKFTRNSKLSADTFVDGSIASTITYNIVQNTGSPGESGGNDSSSLDLTGIKFYTEAIQAQGFDNADDAFNNFNYVYQN